MTDQPPLQDIRRRLVTLGQVRRAARWTCGFSISSSWLLWILAIVMLMDVLFELDVLQRITVLSLAAATLCWALYRYARPYFGLRESEVDLALLMERLHSLDTDLVAAIEFTSPEAASWGSATLRHKVIGDVARRSDRLDMGRGVDRSDPTRKMVLLALTATLATVIFAMFPSYGTTFLRRLTLDDAHYPSRTSIAGITINDQHVLTSDGCHIPRTARCPEQGRVEFQILCTHHLPLSGELLISSVDGSGQRRLRLNRQPSPTAGGQPAALFVAHIPALLNSLEYQIYLGDAWTEPGTIELVPLPQIELHASVSAPAYTGAQSNVTTAPGTYRLTVLEGSHVELSVTSVNNRPLQSVHIELQTPAQKAGHDLISVNNENLRWHLGGERFPLLHSIHETVRFTVHVTDQDGLSPLQALIGEIRVQADLPPDALAATIHQVVLPTAKPQIAYRVQDDYGIGRLQLRLQIERGTLSGRTADAARVKAEEHWLEIDHAFPITAPDLPYHNRRVLHLEPWGLQKGDRIKVTLKATDYRGAARSASVMSKPLYLEISDQAGVLAAILEADQRTEKDLDEMIQRQLDLGESP